MSVLSRQWAKAKPAIDPPTTITLNFGSISDHISQRGLLTRGKYLQRVSLQAGFGLAAETNPGYADLLAEASSPRRNLGSGIEQITLLPSNWPSKTQSTIFPICLRCFRCWNFTVARLYPDIHNTAASSVILTAGLVPPPVVIFILAQYSCGRCQVESGDFFPYC